MRIRIDRHSRIDLRWDGEAAVWIATSGDVPGLVLEDRSLMALLRRVRQAVPTLLELNFDKARP